MPQPPAYNPLGRPFVELQSVGSTNNYALDRIHAGLAQHGEAIFAHEQQAGKGQRGRAWASEKGSNIALSIVANPRPFRAEQQFQLSAAVAIAVHDFFSRYAGDETKIKWPNDLYWQDRKAGGILIESVIGNRATETGGSDSTAWKWAVIGVGININQTVFPAALTNPVSLKQITGKTFDALLLAKELCACIDQRFYQLCHHGFPAIFEQYQSRLYKKDQRVKLKKENRIFEVIIKSVTASGRLVVQHGTEEEFDLGEVEWLTR